MIENSRTIAAIATPPVAGGIGIIRISGENAVKIAEKVFRCADGTSLSSASGYTMKFGRIYDGETLIDEAVALIYRAPKSYTGEDVAELSCHGGIYVLKRVLRLLIDCGAENAQAGEFTKRAFLNGKMDLTQAQSVMDIISANGEQAARGAAAASDGAIYRKIEKIKSPLLLLSAHMAVWTDYPDEDIEELSDENIISQLQIAENELKSLLKSFDAVKVLCGGLSSAIVGKPNVGKSTLMNLLSGSERSIVTANAGTTRDIVEETVSVGSVTLRLADTAGIRESEDEAERIGVDRARRKLQNADLVIAVFDNSQPLDEEDEKIIAMLGDKNTIAIINKTDLDKKIDDKSIFNRFSKVITMSAKNDDNALKLQKAIEEVFGLSNFDVSEGIINNERQREMCVRALECVSEAKNALKSGITFDAVNVLLDSAVSYLMKLTGETPTVEITNAIFENFCVGK